MLAHVDSPFLDQLTPDEAAELRSRAVTRHFARGATIMHQGEEAGRVLVIERGRAKVTVVTEDGTEVVFDSGPVVDAVWLQEELGELGRLVEAGETLEAVSRLAAMARDPRYAIALDERSILEDTLH